jgi:hypothetical protein
MSRARPGSGGPSRLAKGPSACPSGLPFTIRIAGSGRRPRPWSRPSPARAPPPAPGSAEQLRPIPVTSTSSGAMENAWRSVGVTAGELSQHLFREAEGNYTPTDEHARRTLSADSRSSEQNGAGDGRIGSSSERQEPCPWAGARRWLRLCHAELAMFPSHEPGSGPSDSWAARGQGAPRALFAEWSAVPRFALDPRGGDFAQCTDLSVRVSSRERSHPSGNWAFVFGEDRLQSFRMNDDGRLDAIDACEKCSGPGNRGGGPTCSYHRRVASRTCGAATTLRADPPTSGWNVVSSFDVFQVDPAAAARHRSLGIVLDPALSPSSNGSIGVTRAGEDMANPPTAIGRTFANPPFVERYQGPETGAFVLLDRTPASFTETSHRSWPSIRREASCSPPVCRPSRSYATTGQLTPRVEPASPAEQVQTDPRAGGSSSRAGSERRSRDRQVCPQSRIGRAHHWWRPPPAPALPSRHFTSVR